MQLKTIYISTISLIVAHISSFGQIKVSEIEKFHDVLTQTVSPKKGFKDSLSFYTCNVQIEVKKSNHYKPLITSNDTSVSNHLQNLEHFLKTYDYKLMVGNIDNVKLILPIAVVVLDSKYGPKSMDIYELRKVMKMFYYTRPYDDDKTVFYLSPYEVFDDKKNYY